MAFAIIKTGGRQYRVAEGDTIDVDLLDTEPGKQVVIAEVLMHADGDKLAALLHDFETGQWSTPLFPAARDGHEAVVNFGHHDGMTQINVHTAGLHANDFLV